MVEKDPMVGQALDLLVPELDVDQDELLLAAHAGATRVRAARRRQRTVMALASAVLLLFASAALAARQFNLPPFLRTSDPNAARFSISPSRGYHGTAPGALTCTDAGERPFVCDVTASVTAAERSYGFAMRTPKTPPVTRQIMEAALTRAQRNGADPALIARFRAELAGIRDNFIRVLAVTTRLETVSSGGGSAGSPGTERVPPPGVPAWVACRELTSASFQCRPLAALIDVPVGTPLYFLEPGGDSHTVSAPTSQPFDVGRLFQQLLGRRPTAAEWSFFVLFANAANGNPSSSSCSSSGSSKPAGALAVPSPRDAALLAPKNLGAPTRAVSATAMPLPAGRLPVGLARSDGTRLYRVVFDRVSADCANTIGHPQTLYAYITPVKRLNEWQVARISTKP